jgi:type II secretory pathway pseudopilin PulG
MVVVVVIGILATIASVSVKKYIAASKASEASHMISQIKAAEETYKDETFTYLNVTTGLSAKSDFYPNNPSPGQFMMNFAGDGSGRDNWNTLGVHEDAPVRFVYACVAGGAQTTPTSLGDDISVINWPTAPPGKPWYIVKARADLDGDGINTVFTSASFAGELYSNE